MTRDEFQRIDLMFRKVDSEAIRVEEEVTPPFSPAPPPLVRVHVPRPYVCLSFRGPANASIRPIANPTPRPQLRMALSDFDVDTSDVFKGTVTVEEVGLALEQTVLSLEVNSEALESALTKSRVARLEPALESRRVSRIAAVDLPEGTSGGSRPGSAPGAVGDTAPLAGDGAQAILSSSGAANVTTALGLDGGLRVRCRDVASRLRASVRFNETARRLGVENQPDVQLQQPTPLQLMGLDSREGGGRASMGPMSSPTHIPPDVAHYIDQLAVGGSGGGHYPGPPLMQQQQPRAPLPPLKVAARAVARSHVVKQGGAPKGGYRSRPTPRCLKPGALTNLAELRQELATAEKGLELLNQAVQEDVQWVQNNCPSNTLSMKAQLYCKQWGAEKLKAMFGNSEDGRMRKALQKWRTTLRLMHNAQRIKLYLKFKSCRKVMMLMAASCNRMMDRAMQIWITEVWSQRGEEQDAAATEAQVGHGFEDCLPHQRLL